MSFVTGDTFLDLEILLRHSELNYTDSSQPAESFNLFVIPFVAFGIILPILAFIGVAGNTLTLIIYSFKKIQTPAVFLLQALAVTDTLYLLSLTVLLAPICVVYYLKIYSYTGYYYQWNPFLYVHVRGLNHLVLLVNVWVTVTISVERYLTIAFPFKTFATKRRSLVVLGIIVALSCVYSIPDYLIYESATIDCEKKTSTLTPEEIKELGDPNAQTCYEVRKTDFGKHSIFMTYKPYLQSIFFLFLPFAILSVCNLLLAKELKKMIMKRSVSNTLNEEETITLVIVMITLVFLITHIPTIVAAFEPFKGFSFNHLVLISIAENLLALNSAVNFFIYTACGRKFRKALLHLYWIVTRSPKRHTTWTSITRSTERDTAQMKELSASFLDGDKFVVETREKSMMGPDGHGEHDVDQGLAW